MSSVQNEREQALRVYLQTLASQDWVKRTARRSWPNFVYHYTDIRNAISILKQQRIYSRLKAEEEGLLIVSSGSPEILAGTSLDVRDCVRFYFRPQTPTQYHAEGVHSARSLAGSTFPDAHCPVPVFFLFDAAAILARSDVRFSDRGLGGSGYHLGSTLEELKTLPWMQIYHTGRIDGDEPERRNIIACRNAEVIVPQTVDLQSLRYIYCRSTAEKDMLLHLLPPNLRLRYQSKVFASNRSELFFRQRTYVESVNLLSNQISVRFSPDTKSPGPFHLGIEIAIPQRYRHEVDPYQLGPTYEYTLPFARRLASYTIQVTLDEHLVFAGEYKDTSLPV